MNSFLDECLTDDKLFMRQKSQTKKRTKGKNRPSTSLFNKKRKSSGNALVAGYKGRGMRADSAMSVHKSSSKEKYRPASAFAAHYTKSKSKGKKHAKISNSRINVKTQKTRNYPNV